MKLDCPNSQNLGLININLESEKVVSNRFLFSLIKVKNVLPNVEYSTVKYHQLLDSLLPPHLSVKTRQHKAGAEKFGGRPYSQVQASLLAVSSSAQVSEFQNVPA